MTKIGSDLMRCIHICQKLEISENVSENKQNLVTVHNTRENANIHQVMTLFLTRD